MRSSFSQDSLHSVSSRSDVSDLSHINDKDEPDSPLVQKNLPSKKPSPEALSTDRLTSEPSPVKGEARSAWQRGKRLWRRKYWAKELASCFLSMLIIIVLALLLKEYENRPISTWSFAYVSLNSMVAVLSTFFFIFVMMPASSCLAQLKWNNYRQSRPLVDFEIYAEASKSPFASALLLFKRPTHFLAVMGAMLIIAVSTIGPFTQQIISVNTLAQDSGNATLPIAAKYDFPDISVGFGNDFPTAAALYEGLYSTQQLDFNVTSTCGGKNCTWKPYFTLGVKSSCVNVTSVLANTTSQDDDFAFTLPNGHGLYQPKVDPGTELCNLAGAPIFDAPRAKRAFNMSASLPSIAFADISDLILAFSAIYYPKNADLQGGPIAWECGLRFIGQAYEANSTDGAFHEEPVGLPVSNSTDLSKGLRFWLPAADGAKPVTNGQSYWEVSVDLQSPVETEDVSYSVFTAWTLADQLSKIFSGTVDVCQLNPGRGSGIAPLVQNFTSDALQTALPIYMTIADSYIYSQKFTIGDHMDNVARSFSKFLRTSSGGFGVTGGATTEQVIYNIYWPLISAPIVLLLGVMTLMLLTAIDTKRKSLTVWGDSSLANMVYGLDGDARDKFADLEEAEDLEEAAKVTHVHLRDDNGALIKSRDPAN